MAQILYISYTGLLDPLGESQVLQYVRELGREHGMTLLTFEKHERLAGRDGLSAMRNKCEQAGVDWHHRIWHPKPSLPATLWDITVGTPHAVRLAKRKNVQIIHCRSYVGSLIGLNVKRATGARLIFDMRGFWGDERADSGRWSRKGMPYKAVKKLEKTLFRNADHVVSLTRAGVREFERFDYLQRQAPPHSVIPTCTNLDLFRPRPKPEGPFTLGYVGSVGSWYLFDQVAEAVARLFAQDSEARFLLINKGGHERARAMLAEAGVDLDRVEIREAAFDEVGTHIARMDAGIFFIMPAWSKRASCPTRMGEFLGSGRPCLANAGVGDVEQDFSETGTGIVLPTDHSGRVVMTGIDEALKQLKGLSAEPDITERCRAAAEARFSLAGGVAEYDQIYKRLASGMSDE